MKKAIEDAVFQGVSLKASDIPVQPRAAGIDSRLAPIIGENARTQCHGGEESPSPRSPAPEGRGAHLPRDYLHFLTPLPSGEGPGVRASFFSVARAVVSQTWAVTPSKTRPTYQFPDTS